jgi:peptidyl-prolyl cis-trans isomerase SurA
VFRTAIKGVGVIASLAVIAALTGCGPIQMGAAAIVGGQRISTSTLTSDVAALDKVYQANPSIQRNVTYTPARMPQLVLQWLIRFRVIDDMAAHDGIHVSAAASQRALAATTQQIETQAGAAVGAAQFSVYNALPPSFLGKFGHFVATINALAAYYTGLKNVSALTPAQQKVFSARFVADSAAAARRLKIKVNPRFGRYAAAEVGILPVPDTLSKPASS